MAREITLSNASFSKEPQSLEGSDPASLTQL